MFAADLGLDECLTGKPMTDHWIRFHTMLGLVSLHIHDSTYPLYASNLSSNCQHVFTLCTSTSTCTKGRHPTDTSYDCLNNDPDTPHRRQ